MNGPVATYVIAAGGTGGHIFPGVALGREVAARRPGARVVFVGTGRGLEARLVPAAGFQLETVRASGFAGKGPVARMAALVRLPLGFREARRLLRRLAPRAVAGVGGWQFDLDDWRVVWTPAMYSIHELPPDTPLTPALPLDFYEGEGRQQVVRALRQARKEGLSFDFEVPFRTARGRALAKDAKP